MIIEVDQLTRLNLNFMPLIYSTNFKPKFYRSGVINYYLSMSLMFCYRQLELTLSSYKPTRNTANGEAKLMAWRIESTWTREWWNGRVMICQTVAEASVSGYAFKDGTHQVPFCHCIWRPFSHVRGGTSIWTEIIWKYKRTERITM